MDELCAGRPACPDRSDYTPCEPHYSVDPTQSFDQFPHPYPIAVDFWLNGVRYTQLRSGDRCPGTHFRCPESRLCMPVHLRCNGVMDCPGREDEAVCDSYMCPGYYRCRGSTICLHPMHLCDGVQQCPQRDDELCTFNCTVGCTCYGTAFFCRDVFPAGEFPELRFLDGRDSGLTPADLVNNTLLVHLSLARCGLTSLSKMTFKSLQYLDLSRNTISEIRGEHVVDLINLRTLILASNRVTRLFSDTAVVYTFRSITELDLSEVAVSELDDYLLKRFPALRTLNLSGSGVTAVSRQGLRSLRQLRVLDARGCPVTQFPRDIFQGLEHLQSVRVDNYKLCCPAVLPAEFNAAKCHAPQDSVSSCEALLGSSHFRAFVSLYSAVAMAANLGHLAYFLLFRHALQSTALGAFMGQLCVSHFLTGCCLAVVAVADLLYRGRYALEDTHWRKSAACQAAGFLALLSSEVSAFSVFLITADRVSAVFSPRSGFTRRSACCACVSVWLGCALLAAVPLLPELAHWRLYGRTGLCLPLPLGSDLHAAPGDSYVLGVVVVLNSLMATLTGAGQLLLVQRVSHSAPSHPRGTATQPSSTSPHLEIDTAAPSLAATPVVVVASGGTDHSRLARRFESIVTSNILCWLLIGLLGLLASAGVAIPTEVNVAVAIVVMPVNSALNPFLYILSVVSERRKQAREERVKKLIVARIKAHKLNVKQA